MRRRRHGFTLVEIAIVTAIIGLLAVIAVASFITARRQARIAEIANGLRVISEGLQRCAMDEGEYPPDRYPGQAPRGITNYVTRINWTKPTCIGGYWDWDYEQWHFGCKAGISIYMPDWRDGDMAAIDAKLDDGDLSTGLFRKRPAGYIYVIEY